VEETAVDRRTGSTHGGNGHDARADAQRISQVLANLRYPAARWQVLAEADHYGADSTSRAQLWTLPTGVYDDLSDVLVELGLLARTGPRPRTKASVPRRPRR
jgi:hypothetical protein